MIITIINNKGGVGKTTTAAQLGAYLARRGQVLLIDLDAQCNLTRDTGQRGRSPTALELLTGKAQAAECVFSLSARLDLIPASPQLVAADLYIKDAFALSRVLQPIKGGYTHIIIDAPRGGGILAAAALTASTSAIVPTEAEGKSIDGVKAVLNNIELVKARTNPALTVAGILITRYNGRAIISRQMAQALETYAQARGTRVFRARIRECTALKEAAARNTDIFSYAPKSNAARDYAAFSQEVTE